MKKPPILLLHVLLAFLLNGCAELRELRTENARLREANAALTRRATVAEDRAALLERQRSELEETYQSEFRKRGETYQSEISEVAAEQSRLERRIAELEGELARLTQQLEEARATGDALRKELDESRQALARQQAEGEDLKRKLAQAESERNGLRDQAQKTQQQLEAERARLAEAQRKATEAPPPDPVEAAARALESAARQKLEPAVKALGGGVERRGNEVAVLLPAGALFPSGVIELSDAGRQHFARLAPLLVSLPYERLTVAGHTDSQPIETLPFYNNVELSFWRAFAVWRYLTEDAGLDPGRLDVAAFGPHRPLASNATPEGRARNRRVELLLTPRAGP